MNFETIALHGGQEPDKETKSRAVPIYQTTSYVFDSSEHAANLFDLKEPGNIYTRIMNPTTDVLEKRIALLEGAAGALALSSGQSAITFAVLNIAKAGDEIISSASLYGGTRTLFSSTLARFGIKVNFVDSNSPADFEKFINNKTRLLYTETIGNPKLNIADIESLADLAHRNEIPLVVDNTMTTPYLIRPIEHGADIVVHSATKFLGGHGTSIGALLVDSVNFDWKASGKFPELTDPDPSYHGLKYTESFGNLAYIAKARCQLLRDIGSAISPFNSFLILQGIETLHLRMERHCSNSLKIAQFLENHKQVNWVNYPGLKNSPDYSLAQKYLPKGQGGIIGFGIKGDKPAGIKFIDSVKLLSHLANIGDAKSLVIHPASTTHQQLSHEERIAGGVTEDFIRLSAGIEDVEDIIDDIDQALNKTV